MHRQSISLHRTLSIIVLLLLTSCSFQPLPDAPGPAAPPRAVTATLAAPTAAAPRPGPTAAPVSGETIQVYFTSSEGQAGESGALEEALLNDLNGASQSIDIAMYNFSLVRAADALLDAKQRGVRVRMVTDSDALDGAQIHRLEKGGIPMLGDRHEGLMHDKFLVIDGRIVWTGSLNLTGSGAYQDHNNLARFSSSGLAENYTTEFEEMFVKDQFGSDSPANTPHKKLEVAGASVENYFAPEDKVSPKIVDRLREARTSIHFLAYSFTSDPISQAMLDRAKAGVEVRGVFDADQYKSNTGGEYLRMKRGVKTVRLDGSPGLMHHKVIVIDGKTVIFGSYNFTASAERTNDENIVIVTSPKLAAQFEQEFEKVYAEGRD